MYYFGLPFRLAYPSLTWRVKTTSNEIYLTFDDGPIPDVTEFVLDTLQAYNAKATFFCVGDNISKHPSIFNRIIAEGHSVGNHTHNHLNGRKTQNSSYLQNIALCDEQLASTKTKSLFRPPYGRMTYEQLKRTTKTHKVIMWEVLSKDYNPKISPQTCLQHSIKNTKKGSIIVFHDNIKAYNTLKFVLPKYLEHFSKKGYNFCAL